MAGNLTVAGRKVVLNALVGKANSARTVYLGLARTVPTQTDPTLANIAEVSEDGYARVPVTWANAALATNGQVEVANDTDTTLGPPSVDMVAANYAFITDTQTGNTLDAPTMTTPLAAASSGGTFAAGTYYWVVTAVNSRGETIASNEVSATLVLNNEQALSWSAVSGATSYNVYRGSTTSGSYGTLVANVSGTSYTDTGTSELTQSPPSINSASVGDILYLWSLAQPVQALASKPILVPANGLIIE